MQQYLDLMRHVRENGAFKPTERAPVPTAFLVIKCFDLAAGFP